MFSAYNGQVTASELNADHVYSGLSEYHYLLNAG